MQDYSGVPIDPQKAWQMFDRWKNRRWRRKAAVTKSSALVFADVLKLLCPLDPFGRGERISDALAPKAVAGMARNFACFSTAYVSSRCGRHIGNSGSLLNPGAPFRYNSVYSAGWTQGIREPT